MRTSLNEVIMNKWHFVVLFAPLIAFLAFAQDVPPPPNPGNNGPSLAETMRFIQDKMNEQGSVAFTVGEGEDLRHLDWQMSGVIADSTSCVLKANINPVDDLTFAVAAWTSNKYDVSYIEDPASGYQTVSAAFKDITAIGVQSYAVSLQSAGLPQNVTPAVFLLTIRAEGALFKTRWVVSPKYLKKLAKPYRGDYQDQSVPELAFMFRDADMANRVAKAMLHAVELCGGGSKPEPF